MILHQEASSSNRRKVTVRRIPPSIHVLSQKPTLVMKKMYQLVSGQGDIPEYRARNLNHTSIVNCASGFETEVLLVLKIGIEPGYKL